jgi:hypothetical protein
MTKHPLNRHQRKLISKKKHQFVDEKKSKIERERPAKVWRKLSIEGLKEQETLDALQEYRNN